MSLSRVPILTYHSLGQVASPLFVSPAEFDSHLAALAAAGRRTIPLTTVLDKLRRSEPLPANSVVITFDDGYESVYRDAWPRLQFYGFTATVFLITDYCGRDNRWPGQPASVPTRPLLSWSQVEALNAAGCEFGAHTRTHPYLVTLEPAAALDEICASQQAIRDHTGQPVRAFAYPYGEANGQIESLVRRHFDGALGTALGLVEPHSDPYALERVDAYYLTSGLARSIDHGSSRLYLKFRQVLRNARHWFVQDGLPALQGGEVRS